MFVFIYVCMYLDMYLCMYADIYMIKIASASIGVLHIISVAHLGFRLGDDLRFTWHWCFL